MQVLVYIYLLIGVGKLCVAIVEASRASGGSVYVGFRTIFTPFDRFWEPFFLLVALYGLVVLLLQISLRPEWGLNVLWLELILSVFGYLLVFALLFVTQLALFFNLEADLTITEAYASSAKTVLANFAATLLIDIVIAMLVFVGYVSQILLFFLVPLALLLLSVHYFRCLSRRSVQTATP